MEKTMNNSIIGSNLEISEEKNIKNTSLYIKNTKLNEESYEAKILSEENIENIIKYQIIYDGENRILKYDVSNTISLEEYLKSNKLRKKDVCDVLVAIDDMLLSIENYLISENSILLDLKCIRINKYRNNIRYRFITIPNLNHDFSYELSKFLIRILRFVDVEDKDALSLAYSLFVKSSKDNYTMNDLMDLVDKVRDKNVAEKYDVSMEDMLDYDEEMANEISLEAMENKIEYTNDDVYAMSKQLENDDKKTTDENVYDDENHITIDDETNKILEESLLNDFNKEDKKIIKFKKNLFGIKKKKALKGHINVGLIGLSLVPIIIVLLPTLYFIINT